MADRSLHELERRVRASPNDVDALKAYESELVRAGLARRIEDTVLFEEDAQGVEELAHEYHTYASDFIRRNVRAREGRVQKLLVFRHCPRHKRLEVQKFEYLEELDCHYSHLEGLYVSRNRRLKRLNCRENLLEELDVSRNEQLQELDCGYNLLKRLDVSHNTQLQKLRYDGNSHLAVRGQRVY